MKIFLTLILFTSNCVYAQIGIGTTTPTSTLDIRGSLALNYRAFASSLTAAATDNTLMFTGTSAATLTLPDATTCLGRVYIIKNVSSTAPVPVLTVSPTASQTIDGNVNVSLNESFETITVTSNGVGWNETSSLIKKRDNYVLVKSAADLPAAVGGVITLVTGVSYEVNGTIIMTNKINLNGCKIAGGDINNDKLIYTPGSGELFTGTKGGTIRNLTVSAPTTGAKLLNMNLAANENLNFQEMIVASCKDVGIIQGGAIIFISVVNFAGNLNGITFQNCNSLFILNTGWFSTNSNTFEKYVGTFELIEKLGGFCHPLTTMTATAVDITGITAISQAGVIKNVAFIGTGTRVNGIFSNKWEVETLGLTTEKDDVSAGNVYLNSAIATSFSGANVPTKVLGTTTPAALFRVESSQSNRLEYKGTKTRRFSVVASISMTAQVANKNFSFYIYKNGVKLPESEQALRLSSGIDRGSLTLSCTLQMSTNDYIEIWAANTSDASSVTVETLNLAIK